MKEVNVTEVPADAQLIDVRETDEFAEVRAENAINIPMSEFTSRVGELDLNRDIYLICKLGGRSAQVGVWHWWTHHLYPGENTIVSTRSQYHP